MKLIYVLLISLLPTNSLEIMDFLNFTAICNVCHQGSIHADFQ